jgi:hypothetical protein
MLRSNDVWVENLRLKFWKLNWKSKNKSRAISKYFRARPITSSWKYRSEQWWNNAKLDDYGSSETKANGQPASSSSLPQHARLLYGD